MGGHPSLVLADTARSHPLTVPLLGGASLGLVVVVAIAVALARRWRRFPPAVRTAPAVLCLAAILTGIGALTVWHASLTSSDRIALLTLVAAGAALVLAGAAAVIAVASYKQTSEMPVLRVDGQLHPLFANEGFVRTGKPLRTPHTEGEELGWAEFADLVKCEDSPLELRITLYNEGRVSATHAAVRVHLIGLCEINENQPDWVPLPFSAWSLSPFEVRGTWVQWDGRGSEVVHPGFLRQLPALELVGTKALRRFDGPGVKLLNQYGQELSGGLTPEIVIWVAADNLKGEPVRQRVHLRIFDNEDNFRQAIRARLQAALEQRGFRMPVS